MKTVFSPKDLQAFCLTLEKNLSNIHPAVVVGRGSETQLQVSEHLN